MDSEPRIFVNGRPKLVEMLRIMPLEEKTKLLESIESKNPNLAHELWNQSISFEQMVNLTPDELKSLLGENVAPSVLGVALKECLSGFSALYPVCVRSGLCTNGLWGDGRTSF